MTQPTQPILDETVLQNEGIYADDFYAYSTLDVDEVDGRTAPLVKQRMAMLFARLNSETQKINKVKFERSAIIEQILEAKEELEAAQRADAQKFTSDVVVEAETRMTGLTNQLHQQWEALYRHLNKTGQRHLMDDIIQSHSAIADEVEKSKGLIVELSDSLFSGGQGATGMYSVNKGEKMVAEDSLSFLDWIIKSATDATAPQMKKLRAALDKISWSAEMRDYVEDNKKRVSIAAPVQIKPTRSVVFYTGKMSNMNFHKIEGFYLSPNAAGAQPERASKSEEE